MNILLIGACFGLVTGLLEGVAFLVSRDGADVMGVSLEIIWISALFNLLLFSGIAVAVAALTRRFSQVQSTRLPVYLFSFLAFLDLLAVVLFERIHVYAILILALGSAIQFTRWVGRYEAEGLRFWRRNLVTVTAVALLALMVIQTGLWAKERMAISSLPVAALDSPNVLVIVVDTLRADHLSSYGYERSTSPNIDGIARQGVVFENAFSTSSWTLPSHVSLLTGRYPHEHGVEWSTSTTLNNSRHPTLPETMRDRGYRTAAFSANVFWVTRQRIGRGFIRFEDYFHSMADMVLRTLYGRAIERFVLRRLNFEDIPGRKRASNINEAFLRWVDRDRGKPFFALLNYMDTHDPYLPPQPYRNKFSKRNDPGGILNWRVGRNEPQLSQAQLKDEIDGYDGAIAYVDEHIGQLFAKLAERGHAKDTVIVITSDHGESFGEHGLFLHGNGLYHEEIRVPLIFWWPGRVPRGVRLKVPVSNAALPATVMDLTGDKHQPSFPGPSLARAWKTPPVDNDRKHVLAEIAHIPWAPEKAPVYQGSMKSLITEQWHYVVHEKLGIEIYDWSNDPRESRNLAAYPELQAEIAQLGSQLQGFLSNGESSAGKLSGRP